ncbi:DNA oxidative demethylase AlkB [Lichenicoccus roseus]|uniref:DNA oxidative demethylase AlkB n=1 Tax=Lichenicoccus roseus TaxID=2683649 RepID=A0A5R9JFZ1_9PROT|nr:DNA oxidative demethylase AlkB [Lichenicoccus roseus]
MTDLFAGLGPPLPAREQLGDGAWLLHGHVLQHEAALFAAALAVAAQSPFRRMATRGGGMLSVAMTNCGKVGWISDARGYRYDRIDPLTGHPWPELPSLFGSVAREAAMAAGYDALAPDACLVNRYEPRTKLSLHQDRDELDLAAPIVSVSLGLAATFLFGGLQRNAPTRKVRVESGDVVVWGGASRLAFHAVAPLAAGEHRLAGACRINLTFRRVASPA